ncbi:MAG TPA: DUF4097 family beta strand repeat-containing protein [Thermoanaerobaculia bacterium]|nr:DUF4097 family beta strand repeat-containing protein [Thermoanaerobaculia bacterium]
MQSRSLRAPLALAALVCGSLLAGAPAAAQVRLERELALRPGGRLQMDLDGADVVIRGGRASGVHVAVSSSRADIEEWVQLTFEDRDGLAIVRAKRPRGASWGGWWRSGMSLRFDVQVPDEVMLQIETSGGDIDVAGLRGGQRLDTSGGDITVAGNEGDVKADTSGGNIEVRDLTGNADLETSGGSIQALRVRGAVRADTSGGNIRLEQIGSHVDAETSGGSIRLRGVGGLVAAQTSGGSIEAVLAPGNAAGGSLQTSGGSVRVRVDPSVSLTLDAQSSGGSVRSDLPVTIRGRTSRSSLRGEVNGGGKLLRLRTSGGSVTITALE